MENKETWDLYDKDLNFVKPFVRGSGFIPRGLYHKAVEIIPTDMKGYLLLTRRSLLKRIGGGCLEFPAGSVISGETEKDAAIRELREETGLQATKLFFLRRVATDGIIRYIYLACIPELTEQDINYDPHEVMGYQFVSFDRWMDLLTTGEYNIVRTNCYDEKLFAAVKKLVTQDATVPVDIAPKPHVALTQRKALAVKELKQPDRRSLRENDEDPDVHDFGEGDE